MNKSDKIIIGVCVACLGAGVLQRVLTKPDVIAQDNQSLAKPPEEMTLSGEAQDTVFQTSHADFHHEVQWGRASTQDSTVSFNEKKQAAMRVALNKTAPEVVELPHDFDYFRAREDMKRRLFYSNDPDAKNMTDEQKWTLINSNVQSW